MNQNELQKKNDDIKLCVKVDGIQSNEYLSVMYNNKEFTTIPLNVKPTFEEFPYEISILEIGPTPIGREKINYQDYVYSNISLSIKIKEEN